MPIIKIPSGGFRYGKTGKVYRGAGAREKARKQGAAIKLSQLRAQGENIPGPNSIKVKASNRARSYERKL